MKRRNSMAYPGHDVKLFVRWFRRMQEKIIFDEFNKVIKIKYEHFFLDFDVQKKDLCLKLNINPNIKDDFNLVHTKKNLFKFKDKLSNEEIKYIDKELKEFL